MFRFFKFKKKVSFSEQLCELQKIGIQLNPIINEELILAEYSEEEFEREPYLLLLIALGSELELNENYCSNEIWYLDTECIEDTGDYVRIAERIRDLSKNYLDFKNIKDNVDIENQEASISFTLDEKDYCWKLEVNDDWIDEQIIVQFNDLLEIKNTDKRVYILDLGGQDCLVGIYSKEQVKKLNNLLKGSKFVSL
ncbi:MULTISPECIES: hypothetical protein [Bacillaceae]|uniref:Uncharacterized protein n=1 Tax=Gottfriedia luciferensis TaxID=178774 RepID=A0ABX2ZNU8_9BACI|nr:MULTISPECIES: hypothetical protein [Bacillaceae]ODG90994.1 hypothetical protein BED47_08115 [Gottfriedia luciferensis]PGZ87767.1 hypothetical protein COE53_20695 [Bacillus sp. AFS029533]SFC84029.1 hypothetical protein SAMN02799633_01882 [Bacillus sp. UNCCL81]